MNDQKLAEWMVKEKRKAVFGCAATATFKNGHAGLWFDRFGTVAAKGGGGREIPGAQSLVWVKDTVQKYMGARAALGDALDACHTRLEALVLRLGGLSLKASLSHEWTRFVTGMGRPHPVGNGLAWHPTLAVPYLPGSGVKGLTLSWARDWQEADQETVARIFGPNKEEMTKQPAGGSQAHIGSVIFLDALPIKPPEISAEIITPHGNNSGPPQDAGRPNPIGFLAAKSMTLRFYFLPATTHQNVQLQPGADRVQPSDQAARDVDAARRWTAEALQVTGAGAKTKLGYGRFTETSDDAPSD